MLPRLCDNGTLFPAYERAYHENLHFIVDIRHANLCLKVVGHAFSVLHCVNDRPVLCASEGTRDDLGVQGVSNE